MWNVQRSVLVFALAWALGAPAAGCFIDNPGAAPATTTTSGDGGPPDGGDGGATPSICDRYGGYDAVEKVAFDLLGTVAADCRIGAYVTALSPEQRKHFGDCLTKQLAVITKCPDIRYDVDSAGADCRDMKSAHHGLGIRESDFDAFLDDTMTTLHADHVPQGDIDALTPALMFVEYDVVTNSAPHLSRACDAGDGGP